MPAPTRRWRFDRTATVCSPATGQVSAAFAQAAKHQAVGIDLCPPRHGSRKGVVEKADHAAVPRWWRTVADDAAVLTAQQDLDALRESLDQRVRRRDGQRVTVAELAAVEGLRAAPAATFPAKLAVTRTVTAQALVHSRGNRYSVPPGMPGAQVIVRHRFGADALRIVTASGATVAVHRRAPNGATVCDDGHVRALETAVLTAFSDGRPRRSKTRRPAGQATHAEAARLRGTPAASSPERVVIDLSTYAALVPAAARATASCRGSTQFGGSEQ